MVLIRIIKTLICQDYLAQQKLENQRQSWFKDKKRHVWHTKVYDIPHRNLHTGYFHGNRNINQMEYKYVKVVTDRYIYMKVNPQV